MADVTQTDANNDMVDNEPQIHEMPIHESIYGPRHRADLFDTPTYQPTDLSFMGANALQTHDYQTPTHASWKAAVQAKNCDRWDIRDILNGVHPTATLQVGNYMDRMMYILFPREKTETSFGQTVPPVEQIELLAELRNVYPFRAEHEGENDHVHGYCWLFLGTS